MTDKKIMQWAAKAYGYIDDAAKDDDGKIHAGLHKGTDGVFYLVSDDGGWLPWEPHRDNDQAFELAIRAGVSVRRIDPYVYAIGKKQFQARIESGDMMPAAREVVLLAAAEIGKAMP